MKKNVLITPFVLIILLFFISCSKEVPQEEVSIEDSQTEEVSHNKCSTTIKSNKLKETNPEYL